MVCISLGLTYCGCGSNKCPKATLKAQSFLPNYKEKDVIKFKNSKGQSIAFSIQSKTNELQQKRECKNTGYGCYCYGCTATVLWEASANVSIKNRNNYKHTITEDNTVCVCDTFRIQMLVELYDFYVRGTVVGEEMIPEYPDSTLINYTLGGRVYPKLYSVPRDTLRGGYNEGVWKVYMTPKSEIVGFWDRTSKTLFYKE